MRLQMHFLILILTFCANSIYGQIIIRDYRRQNLNSLSDSVVRLSAEEIEKLTPYTGEYITLCTLHSLRIPNHRVEITLEDMKKNKVKVHIKTEPMPGQEQKWKRTAIDTTYQVTTSGFSNVIREFKDIVSSDICNVRLHPAFGVDGTTFKLEYGKSNSYVTYTVWNPYSDTNKRKLRAFIECCEAIIKITNWKISDFYD